MPLLDRPAATGEAPRAFLVLKTMGKDREKLEKTRRRRAFWPGKAGRRPLQGWPKNPSQCCGAFTPDTVRCRSAAGAVQTQFNCRSHLSFCMERACMTEGMPTSRRISRFVILSHSQWLMPNVEALCLRWSLRNGCPERCPTEPCAPPHSALTGSENVR